MALTERITHTSKDRPKLSIVFPTFNEEANIPELYRQLGQHIKSGTELVFVDDSKDKTPDVIRKTAQDYPFSTSLIVRPPDERKGGLATAVVGGLQAAEGEYATVMDADLQHPPHLVTTLHDKAVQDDLDFVIASRYVDGGGNDGLSSPFRKLISKGFGTLARTALPPIRDIEDPMSGFFLVRKDIIEMDKLNPTGYKILLELLIKTQWQSFAEVPYQFGERHAGESKANFKQGVEYLTHLGQLSAYYYGEKIRELSSAAFKPNINLSK